MAFIYFQATTTPRPIPGLVDGKSYVGQNSPDNPDESGPTVIHYREQLDSDPAPVYTTTDRATILAFNTGQINAVAGETVYAWTDKKTATLVLVER